MWTLGDHVAPEHIVVDDDDDYDEDEDEDDEPDRSHRKKLAGLVLLVADSEEGASTDDTLVPFEDSLHLVLPLTHLFIFSIFTLQVIVALELLLHTNLLPGKPPISRRAHHLLPITVSVFSLLDLAAAVQALLTPILTLAGCVTGASVVSVIVAASPFPKCLVAAHLGICALPGGGCVCELGAPVGAEVVIAPELQRKAVALAIVYFAA